ncbi:hypothetical protein DL89DRAFT_261968 [Linderina pennispora]|uniref:Uncharacterized protein n=1 Tax=Linderina pennispora TaxID=61395 RepID=A0A1Y1VTW6_9FUNG|nr:uncharacterized protein DL89DRAFT_261968 [Linderina pennispora]ORX64741.1 hypothetical protein DL89DRAFT_261968 [Linderina pennispora]
MRHTLIPTVPSTENYTMYYNINLIVIEGMAETSCNSTAYRDLYKDSYYWITYAKRNMLNNQSLGNYTATIYDLQLNTSKDKFEVSMLKLTDVGYTDPGSRRSPTAATSS